MRRRASTGARVPCRPPRSARRESSSVRGQFEGHSAHVAFRAEVHYPWHPAHGSEIDVHYREKRGGEEVFVCTLPNAAAAVVVPGWMFERRSCSGMILGPRRSSIGALREVRSILDEIRSAKANGSHGTLPSEESDGKRAARPQAINKRLAADGDPVPDQRANSGSEDSQRGGRPPRTSSAPGGATRQRRRGER